MQLLVNHLRIDGEIAKILIAFVWDPRKVLKTKNCNSLANRKKRDLNVTKFRSGNYASIDEVRIERWRTISMKTC